jgi:hypothetical protein
MLDAGTLAAIVASFRAVRELHLTSDQGSYV